MLTKAWSAALLNALGDILAQKLVDKNENLDLKRLGIFTFLVTTFPLVHRLVNAYLHGCAELHRICC